MELTKDQVAKAKKKSEWDFGNQVLYDLCRQNPSHKDIDQIVGKIWLIGRSYAAAIERRKEVKEDNDTFYTKVVGPTIMKSDIDKWINSLKTVRFPTIANLQNILYVHGNLLNEIEKITGMEKRSLVSKYLHFHRPNLFFIYDSRAITSLRKLTKPVRAKLSKKHNIDIEYAKFCQRCINLRDEIWRTFKTRLSPKELDNLLLTITE